MVVLQVIIEGLATGTVYAGLALALVLVYRMTGVVNFAQGEMGMFGAFVIWWLSQNGLSNYTAMAIGLACSFFLGMAVERVVIRPIVRFGELPVAITTVGIFLLFNELAPWIWGTENRAFPGLFVRGVYSVDGLIVGLDILGTMAIMTIVAAAFLLMLRATKLASPCAARRPIRYQVGWSVSPCSTSLCWAGGSPMSWPRLLAR